MCLKSDQPHEDTLWREESSGNTRNSPQGQQAAPEGIWRGLESTHPAWSPSLHPSAAYSHQLVSHLLHQMPHVMSPLNPGCSGDSCSCFYYLDQDPIPWQLIVAISFPSLLLLGMIHSHVSKSPSSWQMTSLILDRALHSPCRHARMLRTNLEPYAHPIGAADLV